MGEPTIEITDEVEIDAELDATKMSRLIGRQLIETGEGEPYAYLGGLAFDGMSGYGTDIVDILMEYLRNEQSFDLEESELDTIETMLVDAYEP